MRSERYDRFAGACAVALALGGLAYSLAFVLQLAGAGRAATYAAAVFLLVGGLLVTAVAVAVYGRVRETDPAFALWAFALSVAAGLGSALHGGFDLARLLHPPRLGPWDVPNVVDPRGLLTFGVSGLAVLTIAGLILQGGAFPRRLGQLGVLSGLLLLVVYLGRLILFDPRNPILLGAAALEGFLVNPAWYLWLGIELRRPAAVAPPPHG